MHPRGGEQALEELLEKDRVRLGKDTQCILHRLVLEPWWHQRRLQELALR